MTAFRVTFRCPRCNRLAYQIMHCVEGFDLEAEILKHGIDCPGDCGIVAPQSIIINR